MMNLKYLKGSHHGLIKVLSQHCLKEGEERHRNPQVRMTGLPVQASPKYELEHSSIYHGCSLLNQLLSLTALECMDDFQIERLCPADTVGWENLDVGEKCDVLQVSSTLINEKQDLVIFRIQFSI
jgi:hypothetical protein